MILDELGRLTGGKKIEVADRMRTLIESGVIDQFIGIDVSLDDYESAPGTKLIQL